MARDYVKTVYVKLTNRCNLTCDHCYNAVCTDQGQMPAKTLNKILEYIADLKEQGYDVDVALHGGEPMLYKDMDALWEFVQGCNELNASVTMTTNLQFRLTEEDICLFANFKQIDGDVLLLTSWDYKIRFKTQHQLDVWEKNVRKLVKREIKVQPIITLTKIFMEEYTPQRIFEYMHELGVPNLNFERLTRSGRAEENADELMPTNKQVDEWLCEAYRELKTNPKWNFYIPILDGLEWAAEGEFIGCRARMCTANVRTFNPDGSIATCPNIPLDNYGNINKVKTICDVTDKLEGTKAYKELLNRERTKNDECYLCDYYSVCNGDCFQLAWDETGCPGLKKTITEVHKHIASERLNDK